MVVLFNCFLKVSYHFVDTMGLMAVLYTCSFNLSTLHQIFLSHLSIMKTGRHFWTILFYIVSRHEFNYLSKTVGSFCWKTTSNTQVWQLWAHMNNNDGNLAIVATVTPQARGTQQQTVAFLRESWENPVAVSLTVRIPLFRFIENTLLSCNSRFWEAEGHECGRKTHLPREASEKWTQCHREYPFPHAYNGAWCLSWVTERGSISICIDIWFTRMIWDDNCSSLSLFYSFFLLIVRNFRTL